MKPTDISGPHHFAKVVDCQWACPAHTPVPEYIRMVAAGHYSAAYLLNWHSNLFPGILGRTCDRPCEPACRRLRVDRDSVAICRLKRVAADFKDDLRERLPQSAKSNGKRIALIGAGPASLSAARDLALLGYSCDVFDGEAKAGGMIRSRIPNFRLPESVIDEECGYVLDLGINFHSAEPIDSMKKLLSQKFDAIFVGTGAPRGRDLELPGREEAAANIHVGLYWLASVRFGHIARVGKRVLVLGGGNTAMDCARTARRLGGDSVTIVVRSGFDEMKSSAWERSEAMREGVTITNCLVPKEFKHERGRLIGVVFEKVKVAHDEQGRRRLQPTSEPDLFLECDDVLIAVGQETAFPWIERDSLAFDESGRPQIDSVTLQSSRSKVFFGGDAATGAKNIVSAVASGRQAAISIHLFCQGIDPRERPDSQATLLPYAQDATGGLSFEPSLAARFNVPVQENAVALAHLGAEVELGFDLKTALQESRRCLNCDIETVFTPSICIECRACVEICPTQCITFTKDGEEADLRTRLSAPAKNLDQPLYIANGLQSDRVMVKDENVCLHCGYCAEHCPTGAWQMQKFFLHTAKADDAVSSLPRGRTT